MLYIYMHLRRAGCKLSYSFGEVAKSHLEHTLHDWHLSDICTNTRCPKREVIYARIKSTILYGVYIVTIFIILLPLESSQVF